MPTLWFLGHKADHVLLLSKHYQKLAYLTKNLVHHIIKTINIISRTTTNSYHNLGQLPRKLHIIQKIKVLSDLSI